MTTTAAPSVPGQGQPVTTKAVAAVIIGNWFEFYDFLVFTFFALMIGKAFFPADASDSVKLLASLATFWIGFFTRPLGAAVIGAYADRYGRKPALTLTILLMAVGTGLVGITPTYEQIGIAAPIILVVARLIQGFSCGGEVGPATSYLLEASPIEKRALLTSWQGTSQQLAAIAGSGIGVILAFAMTQEDLFEWGWRIPFLLGILIAPVGMYIRRQLPETMHEGETHASTGAVLSSLFKNHSREVVLGVLIIAGGTISTYVFNYMTTYAINTLHVDARVGTTLTFTGAIISIPAIFIGAWIADRFGRKPIIIGSRILFIAAIYPAYLFMTKPGVDATTLIVANGVLNFLFSVATGGFYALLSEALPRAVRSSGLSILYALSVTIFGGSAQLVIQALINATGDPMIPAWYQIGANIVSLLAIAALMPHASEREALASVKRR